MNCTNCNGRGYFSKPISEGGVETETCPECCGDGRQTMPFKSLPVGSHFVFADPVEFSIGKEFLKVKPRIYGLLHSLKTFRIGSINVKVIQTLGPRKP